MCAGSLTLLTGDGHKLVLHYQPFQLDLYRGKDDLVVSMNSQQLMKLEQFRERKKVVDRGQGERRSDQEEHYCYRSRRRGN